MGLMADIELDADAKAEVDRRFRRGMDAWRVPEPMTLDQWACKNFYLSAESSYVEQAWVPWPFQRAIMACISNDDIVEVDLRKSARVGYTKILLAAIGYFAEHKKRNQALWQPTDDDAEDFVKTELDPMLRDVKAMQAVFPTYMSRHKDNTIKQKRFLSSVLRVRGGKAAKNYRRFSADIGYLDELEAFDRDVENEGDPPTLAGKRLEGATFPKLVCGSTPKLRGFSLIDERCARADERFTFQIACPHCDKRHALTWGGKDEPHGFKWHPDDPETVRHLCPHCSCDITQREYLDVAEQGVWINESDTIWLHADGRFTTPDGEQVSTPRHVAFHVWTAYSPAVAWAQIVREFLAAHAKMLEGDDTKMKAWVNTTQGNTWEGEIERTEADDLKARAEPFKLKALPRDCLLVLCGGDTQDNRVELSMWGYGLGGQMWTIEHKVIFGNPALPELWAEVEQFLRTTEYEHACGIPQKIYATAIDSGGHHADAVYAFAHRNKGIRVHAIKGASGQERSIENGNSKVAYRWNGRAEKHGPTLWMVGTNLAKDRLQSRMEVLTPGPGYVHLSRDLSDEWFKQMAGEVRATRRTIHGSETRWTAVRKRVEVRDCVTYAIWLEERLDLWRPRMAAWWKRLAESVQPPPDLFSPKPSAIETDAAPTGDDPRETVKKEKLTAVDVSDQSRRRTTRQRPGGFATNW
jgi:terminase, large subunit